MPTPQIVADTSELEVPPRMSGSAWQLTPPERDLDANIITLPAADEIRAHTGPDLDVLIHVLSGSGTLETAADTLDLSPGLIVWLPRRSSRRFLAGPSGLTYFSVHQRKPGLSIGSRPPLRT
ncbi:hypothetical protein [Brevibacterium sp. 2SA]|uniref:cupin domain-containing protein n=1 Tax=Brevibacterium sp. 2SA TaxID=2502198 RepID=UPI0010F7E9BE|nr:hypothetical protein [Brevibacterium sp. 2SA]